MQVWMKIRLQTNIYMDMDTCICMGYAHKSLKNDYVTASIDILPMKPRETKWDRIVNHVRLDTIIE